jgi:hypothetical protein
MADAAVRLEVCTDDLRELRVAAQAVPEIRPGQVLLKIERFALSANNVTYARLGESLGYWQFYPAEPGWGVIPVWGIGRAERSMTPAVPDGTRISGLFPMGSHVVLQPGRADSGGFTENSQHRRSLPRLYNVYRTVPARASSPSWSAVDDLALVLRPSFWLSFLLAEFLGGQDYLGAEVAVLSSASSKSALGTSRLLSGRLRTIGLTSGGRRAAVAETGAYAQVVTYDDVPSLPGGTAIYLDFAGRPDVTYAVHRHYAPFLRYSALAGLTRGPGTVATDRLPGPQPERFFVPDYIRVRAGEVGVPRLAERFEAALAEFAGWCEDWLAVMHVAGAAAVADAYRAVLDGSSSPATALVCKV